MTDATSRRLGSFAFYGIAGAILAFLILPSLLVVPMSFSATTFLRFPPSGFSLRWYEAYFSDPGWVDATLFSLQIAFMTTVASAVIGTMAAFSLVRGTPAGQGHDRRVASGAAHRPARDRGDRSLFPVRAARACGHAPRIRAHPYCAARCPMSCWSSRRPCSACRPRSRWRASTSARRGSDASRRSRCR